MPAHDDRHPPRKLRKNRAGAKDPAIRDGGVALKFVSWAAENFAWDVCPHTGELILWQVDRMPDKSLRWTAVDSFWKAGRPCPQEAI